MARVRRNSTCASPAVARAGDALHDDALGFRGVAPTEGLHPLALFEVLVMLEEMLDLLDGDLGEVGVVLDLIVASGEPRHLNGDDLPVDARLVLHEKDAYRAHGDHRAGDDAA